MLEWSLVKRDLLIFSAAIHVLEILPMVSMKLDQSCVSLAADAFHHVSELDLDAVGSRPDIFRWISKMSLLQIIDMTFKGRHESSSA